MTMTSTRRFFLQGTAVTGVAAAIAGCSQQSSDEQAGQNSEANSKAADDQLALPSTGWERAEYDEVAEGGTLNLVINQIPANWNNSHPDGNEVSLTWIYEATGGGLTYEENGTPKLDPNYIESAELTSEDPQIVTVKYNEKAKWDNDTPVVVDDFISQWKAMTAPEDAGFSVTSTQGISLISDIRKKSDYEAEIEFSSAFADWMGYLYPSMPASASATPEAWNDAHKTEPQPGNGPFKVANVDATGGVVTLERNPLWWGRTPKLDRIIFKVTTQQNMPQSFANSELDAIDIADGDTYGQAKTRSDAVMQKSNGRTWTHLTINTTGADGVLGDVKVREAIFRGVNRNAVASAVVNPLEAPVIDQNNYIYMPGQAGYEDSFDGKLTFDQEAAKKVLDDAGWALNGDVREKDGKQLAFSIVIPAETKSNEDRARQVMTNLNEIGFKVDLQTVPSDKYFTDYVLPKTYSLVTFSWRGTRLPELTGTNIFLPESAQNYTNFKDESLVDLDAKVQSEMDKEERRKLANEFSTKVANEYTVLPFYATPVVFAVKEGLVNYGAAQFESYDYTAVGYKKA
ncbi:MAG: ABC transporter family substrate-binding protein [Dermabacter sp.]|nr:ABC transporter family substrate-binding protein [Dermabacter sp.]